MAAPLCFVLMPFGTKRAADGSAVHFDRVYTELFAPAIAAADMEAIRADEEQVGGIIHTPMFERLVLCEYALADLTTANANVFYELGVRHAARPWSTVLAFAEGLGQLPFDVAPLRALPYRLGADGGPADPAGARSRIVERLKAARERSVDSPLYALLQDYPNVAHEKTDIFRKQVALSESHKREIERRRRIKPAEQAVGALREYEAALGDPADMEAGLAVSLFLAYRDLKGYGEMLRLAEAMAAPLRETVLVREQYAFALNREGRSEEAESVLKQLLAERGPSSETYGLLGRVYKDRYDAARKGGDDALAKVWLQRAIDAYRKGFDADLRDDYPGVNAVTLMAIREHDDPSLAELLPVVRYAARQRVAQGKAGYWGYATLFELAVIAGDEAGARAALAEALAERPEPWMRETTLNNLRLLRGAGVRARLTEELERLL